MVKEIITVDNQDEELVAKLNTRCDEFNARKDNKIMREIILDLKDTIRENNLSSLSANQLGYDKRIFVINFNGDLRSFINPIITEPKGFELSRETCSSIPGKTFIRPRHSSVKVLYQTPLSKIESREMIGLAARVFQHELDHIDGLLLTDVGLEIDENFDNASEEEKNEVINYYLDSLDIKRKQLEAEIKEDETLSKMDSAITFMEKLQKGEITIVKEKTNIEGDDKEDVKVIDSDKDEKEISE